MKTKLIAIAASLLAFAINSRAQDTAFAYQGRLNHGGAAANGLYEMSFALYDAMTSGNIVGTPVTVAPLPVTNGLFTTTLDFGAAAFTGADRWLEISVTVFGSDQPVVTLVPRQPITPAPYALHAANAAGLMSFANAPLDIKVNGHRVLRLEANPGDAPNFIGGASVNGVAAGVLGATIGGGGTSSPGFEATNRVEANYGTISGGAANTIQPLSRNSVIGGGWQNTIHAGSGWSTISGGEANTIQLNARYTTISGGGLNRAGGYGSVIGGGSLNSVKTNAEHSSIGGGLRNFIAENAMFSTIAGGNANTNAREYGTIGGGDLNATAGFYATVGGGRRNTSSGGFATVAGGYENTASEETATVGGGFSNHAGHEASTVAGGSGNTADADYATVGGGSGNTSSGDMATVGGGLANAASGQIATIAGGERNSASGWWATVSGGQDNVSSGNFAMVGAGANNQATGYAATVTGGGGFDPDGNAPLGNQAQGQWSAIGGGALNKTFGRFSTVGGGYFNTASNLFGSTVAGGTENTSGGNYSTVGGGVGNSSDGHAAAIGGGAGNVTMADLATVGGGSGNRSIKNAATVPGGKDNVAGGTYSFAAGFGAQALHDGALVWADASSLNSSMIPFISTAINQFAVRATGGVRFVTAIDTNGSNIAGVSLAPGSGAWSSLSDRNAKENLVAANSREILNKVAALPMTSWNYKAQGAGVRHLGPMAQDFHTAFGLGESDRTITTVDSDGVALAAIQGLNQKVEEKEARIRALERELGVLKELLAKIATTKH